MNKYIYPAIIILLLVFATFFYSFRLTSTPQGMTIDESSIAYNSALMSKTLKDETGNFMPVFALTIKGSDWKQPVSLYATAIIFKIFGISLFSLKFVNVLVAVISLLLIIQINYLLLGKKAGIIAGLIFLLTPTILMHSHLAQENIMPVLFISAWLLFILLFQKNKKLLYLFMAGISIGIGIYSYKGMRALTPPLIIISTIYLYISTNKKKLKAIFLYLLGLSPFVLAMPRLNTNYAGALFDSQGFNTLKYYDFFYPYISSFDISALFIKGDVTIWHSTGLHGVFLLSTLPLFIIGLIQATKDKKHHNFYQFLLISFFLTPILFGQVGSVYRFSRLLIFVPFYVSFCTLSLINIQKQYKGKILSILLGSLIILNFADFTRYYWYLYPEITRDSFSENNDKNYKQLSDLANEQNLSPYVYIDEYISQGDNARFYEEAYFESKLGQWKPGDKVPNGIILMTKLENQQGFVNIKKQGNMNFLVYQ